MEDNDQKFSIFMFINSGSGSGVGQKLKELDVNLLLFRQTESTSKLTGLSMIPISSICAKTGRKVLSNLSSTQSRKKMSLLSSVEVTAL